MRFTRAKEWGVRWKTYISGERTGQWARDEERKDRGREEMEAEARWLRGEMERDAEKEEGRL